MNKIKILLSFLTTLKRSPQTFNTYIFVYFEIPKIYNFSSCMSFNADVKKNSLIIYSKTFCCDISPTRKMFFLAEKYVFFISICKRVTRKICLTCD